MMGRNLKYTPLFAFQLVLLVLFFIFVRHTTLKDQSKGFEGTHVMIFIGFGFLMTFLKKYCFSALGFNWLLASLAIQWAILCQQFYSMKDNTILLSKEVIIEADVMSATVLITFGALLGCASDLQLILITIIEVAVGCFNFWLVSYKFMAADVGGSIAIHSFGAYFGLGVSAALRKKKSSETEQPEPAPIDLNGSTYNTDVTAMLGSIFLWIYWPAFNSALTSADAEYQRAFINTYLAMASAVVTTFFFSSAVSHGKLDMVHIQNSTLAGGVAVGSICNMHIGPGGAIAVGICAGALSVLGYKYLTPAINKLGIKDTCGVNNLHGMPGVLSGLLSVLFAALATKENYGSELGNVFEAMGDGRTATNQAFYQLAAVGTTIALSFGSGLITGYLAKLSIFSPLQVEQFYDDERDWELPS